MAEQCYCDQCGVSIPVSETHCSSCGAELSPFVDIDGGGQGEIPLLTSEKKVEAAKDTAPNRPSEGATRTTTSMPTEFKFIRDFSMINWKATGQVNLIRAAFAGPVLGLLMAFSTGSPKMFFTYAFLFPFMYIVALVPMALVAYWLSSLGVPVAGWFAIILSFMVALGDPFTSILSKKRPDLVPVQDFGLFNLKPIIFVLNEPGGPQEIERARATNIDEQKHTISADATKHESARTQTTMPVAPDTPQEVSFLREAAESFNESAEDLHNRAIDSLNKGNTVAAIHVCNAALQKPSSPCIQISLHSIRSQATAEHFQLDNQNKASGRLIHVIAWEHILRDWEAIIGLWVENAASFGDEDRGSLGPMFDRAYANHFRFTIGNRMFKDDKGEVHKYVQRVPRTWQVDWMMVVDTGASGKQDTVLSVNGRRYPQYKLRMDGRPSQIAPQNILTESDAMPSPIPQAFGGSPAANEAKDVPTTQERKTGQLLRTTVPIPAESGDHKAEQASRALDLEDWVSQKFPEFIMSIMAGSEILTADGNDLDRFMHDDIREYWEVVKTNGRVNELRSALEHKLRGVKFSEDGKHADAIREYRKAVEAFPEGPHFRFQLAVGLHAAKEYSEAVELLVEYLTAKPDDWEAKYELSRCYCALEDLQRAIDLMEDCIRTHPDPDMHYFMGRVCEAQGNKLGIDLCNRLGRLDQQRVAEIACPYYEKALWHLSECRKKGGKFDPEIFNKVCRTYDEVLPGGLQTLGVPLSLNRLKTATYSIDIPGPVADAEFSPATKVCSAWAASCNKFGSGRTLFKVYLFETDNIDDIKRAAQPVAIAEIVFPGQDDSNVAEVTLTQQSYSTAGSKQPQGAQQSPPEVAFLTEAAEIPSTDSVVDIWNRADQVASDGDSIEAIRLFNAALRMASLPETEFYLHHIRSQLIVRHFGFDGRNKTSHLLSHVIAKEHMIRDWEAMIGLWAESSPSFGEDARKQFQPIFDHVYVNYMPMTMALMTAITTDGQYQSYEPRVPVKWKIAWGDVLLVNGREYQEYKFRKP